MKAQHVRKLAHLIKKMIASILAIVPEGLFFREIEHITFPPAPVLYVARWLPPMEDPCGIEGMLGNLQHRSHRVKFLPKKWEMVPRVCCSPND